MRPEEAAWVREHAWVDSMRQRWKEYVALGHDGYHPWTSSPCQMGPCGACPAGDHRRCITRERIVSPAPWMTTVEIEPGGWSDTTWRIPSRVLTDCRGWVCPCGCWREALRPAPMTDEQAAWVREHVWPAPLRKSYEGTPGFYQACACGYGPTGWCLQGRHDQCGRGEPLRSYETLVCRPGGVTPAHFPEDFTHPSDISATGPRRTSEAMVWLADRVCRWACPCDCGHTGVPAKAPSHPGDDGTDRRVEQLDLFDLV